jgi:RNA polymerase sigma-70 factor, ECF subfamily
MDASTTIGSPSIPNKSNKSKEKNIRKRRGEEKPPAAPMSAASLNLVEGATDEVLMVQLGEGSREALAGLFRRYARAVRSIAYRALRDSSEADDLVQDIFLVVDRDAKAFDPAKGTARTWILQIAQRRAISRHRYLRSRHFYNRVDLDNLAGELEDFRASARQAGDPIDEAFGKAGFERVLDQLSGNQRETLRLHFFEGYTLAEIATRLGQSAGNIKHHYFRGLERLRKHLFAGKLQGNRTVW